MQTINPTATVLIVDDQELLRRGLASALVDYGLRQISEASTLSEALSHLSAGKYDLALVDIAAATDGVDVIRALRQQDSEIKILVFTLQDEMLYGDRAVRAGACAYVDKRAKPAKLLEAIERVLEGDFYFSDRLTKHLLRKASGGGDSRFRAPGESLTDRELDVFTMLGRGSTTREIASRLDVSVKTIETHRRNIMLKLGLQNSVQLVQRATHWLLEPN